MDDRVSPVGPLAGAVVAEMLTPFMVYADLLRAVSHDIRTPLTGKVN